MRYRKRMKRLALSIGAHDSLNARHGRVAVPLACIVALAQGSTPSARARDDRLTAVAGIKVGHVTLTERPTGCTVILVDGDAVGGVSQRGGAPGTRETDLLNPLNMVDKVNAVVLAGGSAFGLEAATGTVRWLEEHNIGWPAGRGARADRARRRSCSTSASAATRRSARPPTAATRRPRRRRPRRSWKAASAPAPARPSASSAARAARRSRASAARRSPCPTA